ncbi:ABC transporter ATP-binding protein [Georgenia subflava]|uniref:ATP-binding cassette domain-containing protein n=1 Tax=Georgenia subflava TaxID=1622177 RepID=A0A6N7EL97_9MICO|nr:ABC transporter ATP-binding protein [Georgenia subflava]MPV36034.1 ATP-binding cassette domain-containing protein [Georgenia subflava]
MTTHPPDPAASGHGQPPSGPPHPPPGHGQPPSGQATPSQTPPALAVHAASPERDVHLDVEVPAGQVLAVLGANGAGKSTLLALAAGTLRPGSGRVRIAGRTVADDHTWVPAHARRVSLLAQEALLFPHLDAVANVAFGPRATGTGRRAAERLAHDLLDRVGAGELARRRPARLSGGQAQRVALARALATDPELILLDEPLSALDVDSAAAMRQLLREVLRGTGRSAVLVTHDLLDVLAVADAVVVLEEGRVAEHGPALEVLTRPRSRFAAALAGTNLVAGTLTGTGPDAAVLTGHVPRGRGVPPGADRAGTDRHPSTALVLHGLADPACRPGSAVAATFSPRSVAVHRHAPGGSPRNTLAVTVTTLEQQGELVRVRAATPTGQVLAADITPASVASLALAPGQPVVYAVKAAEVQIYPA